MKKPLLLAAFVAASLSMTVANANSYNVRNSDGAGCSQNEDTGKSLEFGTTYDSASDNTTFSAMWTFQLGKQKMRKIDCNRLFDITVAREQLELDKARLELQLLRAQIKAAKSGTEAPQSVGDDW